MPLHADIGPSLLACDLASLGEEAERVVRAGADSLHVDVMDGNLVPNISWGMPVVDCLQKHFAKVDMAKPFFDVHMMVLRPQQWVEPMAKCGADRYTFHVEAEGESKDTALAISKTGMKVGVACSPPTPVQKILDLLADAEVRAVTDLVLIMTVHPGFGGQKFMPEMMAKVKAVRAAFPDLNVQVDGGLGPETVGAAAEAGANCIVAGSAVFKPDPGAESTIKTLRASVESAGVVAKKA